MGTKLLLHKLFHNEKPYFNVSNYFRLYDFSAQKNRLDGAQRVNFCRALKLPVEAFGEVCSQAVGNPLFLE